MTTHPDITAQLKDMDRRNRKDRRALQDAITRQDTRETHRLRGLLKRRTLRMMRLEILQRDARKGTAS